MGIEELAELKAEIKEYKMEVKQLRVESAEETEAVTSLRDMFYEEFTKISGGQNEIKALLFNDTRTGRRGLVQNFSDLKEDFFDVKNIVTDMVEKRVSYKNRILRNWSVITTISLVVWELFKNKESIIHFFHG